MSELKCIHGKADCFYEHYERKGEAQHQTHYCPGCGHGIAHKLLAESIVAVSKTLPEQRVTSASMVFLRAASFTAPVDLSVELLRKGRTFSTAEVRATQHGTLRGAAILLSDSGAEDVIHHVDEMPDVPGPAEAVPFEGFGMPGREIRVVDGAYDLNPDRVGPPEINAWVRFRDAPDRTAAVVVVHEPKPVAVVEGGAPLAAGLRRGSRLGVRLGVHGTSQPGGAGPAPRSAYSGTYSTSAPTRGRAARTAKPMAVATTAGGGPGRRRAGAARTCGP